MALACLITKGEFNRKSACEGTVVSCRRPTIMLGSAKSKARRNSGSRFRTMGKYTLRWDTFSSEFLGMVIPRPTLPLPALATAEPLTGSTSSSPEAKSMASRRASASRRRTLALQSNLIERQGNHAGWVTLVDVLIEIKRIKSCNKDSKINFMSECRLVISTTSQPRRVIW